MSLFKSQILGSYDLMQYQNDFLLLHCSKNDRVRAPFDGKVEVVEDGCILYNDYFKLYISHMQCDKDQEVSAGQLIGTPKFDKILGIEKAYIGVKLFCKDELCNVVTYLHHRDEDICGDIRSDEIEEAPKSKGKSDKKKK